MELGDRGRILLDLSMAGKALVDQQGVSLVDPKTVDDKIWAIATGTSLGCGIIRFDGRIADRKCVGCENIVLGIRRPDSEVIGRLIAFSSDNAHKSHQESV